MFEDAESIPVSLSGQGLFFFFNIFLFMYLFIFGCPGSSLLHWLFSSCFSLTAESGSCSLAVMGGLLIAVASLGHVGFRGRSSQALEPRVSSCGAWV